MHHEIQFKWATMATSTLTGIKEIKGFVSLVFHLSSGDYTAGSLWDMVRDLTISVLIQVTGWYITGWTVPSATALSVTWNTSSQARQGVRKQNTAGSSPGSSRQSRWPVLDSSSSIPGSVPQHNLAFSPDAAQRWPGIAQGPQRAVANHWKRQNVHLCHPRPETLLQGTPTANHLRFWSGRAARTEKETNPHEGLMVPVLLNSARQKCQEI